MKLIDLKGNYDPAPEVLTPEPALFLSNLGNDSEYGYLRWLEDDTPQSCILTPLITRTLKSALLDRDRLAFNLEVALTTHQIVRVPQTTEEFVSLVERISKAVK